VIPFLQGKRDTVRKNGFEIFTKIGGCLQKVFSSSDFSRKLVVLLSDSIQVLDTIA
jgi:hypothetical protein